MSEDANLKLLQEFERKNPECRTWQADRSYMAICLRALIGLCRMWEPDHSSQDDVRWIGFAESYLAKLETQYSSDKPLSPESSLSDNELVITARVCSVCHSRPCDWDRHPSNDNEQACDCSYGPDDEYVRNQPDYYDRDKRQPTQKEEMPGISWTEYKPQPSDNERVMDLIRAAEKYFCQTEKDCHCLDMNYEVCDVCKEQLLAISVATNALP